MNWERKFGESKLVLCGVLAGAERRGEEEGKRKGRGKKEEGRGEE